MIKAPAFRSTFGTHALRGIVLATAFAAVAGCVTQVRVAAPVPVVEVQTREAPPPLPEYDQPPIPEDGYLWTPGYWAWGGGGYYWVPGTWVQPPRVGVLWTPGYWGFAGGAYVFHAGYWGPHVGFYGGINYGFGYVGTGFAGGAWVGNAFSYNRAVTNVNVTIVHNTYNTTVVNNVTVNRVSFNGGAGGVAAAPSAQEQHAAQEPHTPPTPLQRQHIQQAEQNPALSARSNGGHPTIAATPRPAAFTGPGVVGAHGAGPAAAAHPNPPAMAARPPQAFQKQETPNHDATPPANNPKLAPHAKGAHPNQKPKHPNDKPHPKKKDKEGADH